jgi:hypothetical protein
MPVNLPSGLFARGVNVDISPVVKASMKAAAERKAASDAIIKNVQDLANKINPAQIRSVDLDDYVDPTTGTKAPGINTLMQQFKENSMATGQTDIATYNKILSTAEESKNRVQFIKDIGKATFEGKLDASKMDVKFMEKLNKPVNDPTSKKPDGTSFDWSDLPANIPEFKTKDVEDLFKFASNGIKTQDLGIIEKNPAAGTVTTYTGYSPDAAKSIATGAAMLINNSKSAKNNYEYQADDPQFKATYEPDFEKIFGKKIENAQDAAAAQMLNLALNYKDPQTKTDPQIALDKEARDRAFSIEQQQRGFTHSEKMQAQSQAFQLSKDGGAGVNKNKMDNYTASVGKTYTSGGNKQFKGTPFETKGKDFIMIPVSQIDPIEYKEITGGKIDVFYQKGIGDFLAADPKTGDWYYPGGVLRRGRFDKK